jgi:hypothetical protein
VANSTIESALYTLVKCGENLISAINSVLWVCVHKGVFYIQKNFSKNFSIHPNISPVSFGRYTGREKRQKPWHSEREEVNSYGATFF